MPVDGIVEQLMRRKDAHRASLELGVSFAEGVREGNSEALIRLALAHYVWTNTRMEADVMAEIVAVMRWQGVKKKNG